MILCIESTSKNCSVALVRDGEVVRIREERGEGYSHAEKLHVFIEEIILGEDMKPSGLRAVAVSKGPGSYTGLRIGVSAAKGLAYALDIPLIAVDTLGMMALQVAKEHRADVYLPVVDARRMEVYCGKYDAEGQAISETRAAIIEPDFYDVKDKKVLIFGEGSEKCISSLPANYTVLPDIFPSAAMMAEPASRYLEQGLTEDVAYFEPFYLKEFVAGGARNG